MIALEQLLADLIRIDTSNPPGNEAAAAKYLQGLFTQYEVECGVVEASPGRANFWARLGNGEAPRLLYFSHSDVVPAGEGWEFNPFGGEIANGFVLGRGALDCKGLLAAEAWTFLNLAKRRQELRGTLTLVAAADEERGGSLGARYLSENFPQLLKADLAINEGAEEPVTLGTAPLYFIQTGEKGIAQCTIQTKGIAAHGSVPELGQNAIKEMLTVGTRLSSYQPEIRIIPQVEALLSGLAGLLGKDWPPIGGDEGLESFLAEVAQERGFREYLRALIRMTVSPNVVRGGQKVNIVPDNCSLEVDIRVLPGQDEDYVRRELKHCLTPSANLIMPEFEPPSFSVLNTTGYQLARETMAELLPGAMVVPCMSTGATDSRFLRQLGVPAYGISILSLDQAEILRPTIHGRNERIDLGSLRLTAEYLNLLAWKYLG